MIEGFFQLTTALGIAGLAVVWQADSLIEMFTLNPEQKKGLKRHKHAAMKSAMILVVLDPLYAVAGSVMVSGWPTVLIWLRCSRSISRVTSMSHVRVAVIAGLLAMSLAAGIATADPSRPDTEDNGLSQNESTTLGHTIQISISRKRHTSKHTIVIEPLSSRLPSVQTLQSILPTPISPVARTSKTLMPRSLLFGPSVNA